ncbi:MAG: flavin reductase family protein [Clostridia bacterium]|nr:flavin reductase family protein [Clostridia bacterium]
MAKVAWGGGALLAPVPPVMVTCGDMENSNIITVAWTGIINTKPPRLTIAVRPTRYSYNIIKERGEFAVNLTPAQLVRTADFCGIYTGAKVDKFKKTGLTKAEAQNISAPIINECPLALECKVIQIIPQETHDLFLAEIVAVDVDTDIIDSNGKLRLDKAGLAAFAHGEYFELGRRLGRFGFSTDKSKSTNKKYKNNKHSERKKD